jgi:hypothetical protein
MANQATSDIKKAVEIIKNDPNGYCIILGDIAESRLIDHPYFQYDLANKETLTPLKQYDAFIKDFEPISKKILTILTGNHDWSLNKFGDLVENYVCKQLKVPYGTYSCKYTFLNKDGSLMFKGFFMHGAFFLRTTADDPIRRKSNLLLSLKRALKGKAGDCVLMAQGHSHKLICSYPEHSLYLIDDGSKIKQNYTSTKQNSEYIHADHRFYACTGSFLKMYGELGTSSYSERLGLDPVELGYIKCEIKDGNIQDIREVTI